MTALRPPPAGQQTGKRWTTSTRFRALGTADQLKHGVGRERVAVVPSGPDDFRARPDDRLALADQPTLDDVFFALPQRASNTPAANPVSAIGERNDEPRAAR
ncbi:hypothetical protein Strop_4363 [Salinispora tropica CNB-440]|uniref:Uncharacterized protein n=1 Tax=Salinispora tropica (strain ATCC BAA-916 / DSM 44818 / JCM 13857 / NBRC 105044 / CNB-440) TaxID=369723 RepID=A4XCY4_SALTO|nr:hypothetical protein Strop_4363 [Salinispora tropica CNB-440]